MAFFFYEHADAFSFSIVPQTFFTWFIGFYCWASTLSFCEVPYVLFHQYYRLSLTVSCIHNFCTISLSSHIFCTSSSKGSTHRWTSVLLIFFYHLVILVLYPFALPHSELQNQHWSAKYWKTTTPMCLLWRTMSSMPSSSRSLPMLPTPIHHPHHSTTMTTSVLALALLLSIHHLITTSIPHFSIQFFTIYRSFLYFQELSLLHQNNLPMMRVHLPQLYPANLIFQE